MLKRVAAIGSSTAVIGALLTGALSTPALAACTPAAEPTASDGVRQVSEGAHLEWILANTSRWSLDYALTSSFIYTCTWTNQAIGNSTTKFTGTFDGGGYTISGLTINGGTSTDYMGLFGYTDDANISNLGFAGNVSGDDRVGGLIGKAANTTVTNSWATGDVTGDDDFVGGLIGEAEGSAVTNSWAEGAVTSNGTNGDEVGGLIGYTLASTTVTGSWATGSATANSGSDSNDVGGLIGQADDSTITDSWASGSVTASESRAGGLVGYALRAQVNNSYASGATVSAGDDDDDSDAGGLVGLSSATDVSGSWASPAVTASEDYAGGLIGRSVGGSVTTSWATGTAGGDDQIGGLIGKTDGTTVTSSYATGSVSGDSDTGGLVGNADGDISGSYATGSVTGTGSDAGGLVGEMSSSTTVSGSWATGSAQTSADYAAGLVAEANSGTIRNSWASGTVTATGPDGYAGGLTARTAGVVLRSFATGPVSATNNYVGGLVGDAEGATITDSYASGAVSGAEYIGGLVGQGWSSTQIQSSYSVGAVTGTARTGGLVGVVDSSTVASSYWNTETSGLSSSDGGTGKTIAEMQDVTTYAGWSISEGYNPASTWGICGPVNSGYPYLTAFNSSDPCVAPPPSYQFTFRLPDGTECGAIGPVGVIDGTIYILPGEDADCRTMEGALVGGWTIPVPEGYDSIGSPAMPFAPGQKVRVSDSQQFTVVPFEPLLSLTLDSNVMADEACEVNEVEFVDEANREEYSWVPRGDIAMARLPMVAACQPPGYTLAGWNTASDGSGTMFEPGAGLPSEWATDKTNRYRLFAIWSPA